MAIKMGEHFCYLPLLTLKEKKKEKKEEPKKDEDGEGIEKATVEITTADGVKVISSILETKSLKTAYDTSLTAEVDLKSVPDPEDIRSFTSKELASMNGKISKIQRQCIS